MSLKNELKKWEKLFYTRAVEEFPERKRSFKTSFGTIIQPIYIPQNNILTYQEKLGFPGEYPFTRGSRPSLYRSKFWTMRQYAGYGTASETNQRFKYLIKQGQNGLSIAFDLPTQIGYDSDHPMSDGEVGKVGVAIDSLRDMEILFNEIPLNKISCSMTVNATAIVILAMYVAVSEKSQYKICELEGTIQNDILKEYYARGTYCFPLNPSMRLITDILAYCSKEMPKWNTLSVSGYHIREAGCDAVQEIAFALADGIAYVEAALKAGLAVDTFAPRLSFFFSAHNNLLEEIAKFRAARRLWAKIMKSRFSASSTSQILRFHAQTAGSTLTAQQPDNNIVRVSIQTLAAVLGGTQSLHTNSRDEAWSLPTEDSVCIAMRTQQIVAYESGVADTIDPLAGSYYIEKLTDTIEEKAVEYIQQIDNLGGMAEAIEAGFIQHEVQESSYRYQKAIENGELVVIGVNKFQVQDENPQNLLKIDPAIQVRQIESINKVKAERNNDLVNQTLFDVRTAAQSGENMMPSIIEAVKSYATLGEIMDEMKKVFGEHTDAKILINKGDQQKIRILIAKPGLDGHDRGAKFVVQALHDAGMDVIYTGLRLTPEAIAKMAIRENVDAIGLSSLSGAHNTTFPRVVDFLGKNGAKNIFVFGGGIIPESDIPYLKQHGIEAIFTPGTSSEHFIKYIRENVRIQNNR